MIKRFFSCVLITCGCLLIAASLSAQERMVFPVGASTKTAGYTPLWAGVKQGFFAKQGLEVQPVVIRGSDRAIQVLAGGSVYASVIAPDAPMVAADRGLDSMIIAGNQHFLFANDFPHEIGPDDILHEIEEVMEAPISADDKRGVLRENAKRFYRV